jgi:hypothetical protein
LYNTLGLHPVSVIGLWCFFHSSSSLIWYSRLPYQD